MQATEDQILQLERKALDRWSQEGKIDYHAIYADDVTYFDPLTRARIDGLKALSTYCESAQGQNEVSRYEIANPLVVETEGLAVLSYNLTTYEREGDEEKLGGSWNCTEVYRQESEGWKIVHSHWSHTAHEAFIAEAQPAVGEAGA